MNKLEQAAFVTAYANNVADAPQDIVEEFITDYENGEDMPYSEHYTSIVDALGMWKAGITYQLQRTRDGKI
jgi:hypothetical protein